MNLYILAGFHSHVDVIFFLGAAVERHRSPSGSRQEFVPFLAFLAGQVAKSHSDEHSYDDAHYDRAPYYLIVDTRQRSTLNRKIGHIENTHF